MYEKYRDKGLTFLSINAHWDKEPDAKRFIEQYRLPFPVGRDANGGIAILFGVEATPTSLFIAKDGKLIERVEEGMEEAAFERRITSLLTS